MAKRLRRPPLDADRNYEDEKYDHSIAAFQRRSKTSRNFLDQFLLSIIDAYSAPIGLRDSKSKILSARRMRERRLVAAKKALFAAHEVENTMTEEDLLFEMAAIRRRKIEAADKSEPVSIRPTERRQAKEISDRQLAREAAAKFFGGLSATNRTMGRSEDPNVERLRKKFAAERDYYIRTEKDSDFVAECFERNKLEQLKKILRGCGIQMKVPLFPGETPRAT